MLRNKKARQARIGHHGRSERSERFPRHRGHMSKSAHSLEAGSSFPVYKKKSEEILCLLMLRKCFKKPRKSDMPWRK
ncbi:MAG: hypothetical protein FWF77_07240 [Defluviitaleaceae bacterium]|nr:hypothetical protein [Defluviitaleaceae bacterium]